MVLPTQRRDQMSTSGVITVMIDPQVTVRRIDAAMEIVRMFKELCQCGANTEETKERQQAVGKRTLSLYMSAATYLIQQFDQPTQIDVINPSTPPTMDLSAVPERNQTLHHSPDFFGRG